MRLTNVFFLFTFLLIGTTVKAQQEKQPLREVLQSIEKQFSVSFTYTDENVENVLVEQLPTNLTLTQVLTFLSNQTGLLFTQLDQRFITISRPLLKNTITVCGILEDNETHEKIVGATIQAGDKFAVSDKDGYFELSDLDYESILLIKSLGYEAVSVAARSLVDKPCTVFSLVLQPSYLSEVTITNYLTTGIVKKIDGSLSIQTQDLGILPGLTEPDVLITIQALPGIQSIDETVSNINVRGGTHDQNLVLWDGMKMYQQGHFFGLISAFSPYLTKEVNLVKNGTSAMHSDGVSSTIDIQSDDEVTNVFTGGAGINMIDLDLLAKIPVSPKVSLHLSGRKSIADIVETPTYRSYYDRAFRNTDVTSNSNDTLQTGEQFHFYDFSTKLLYDISDKDKLRVSFLKIHNSIEYEETETVNGTPESKVSSLEQQNLAGGITYSRLWNANVRTTGQWYLSSYDLNATNFDILNDQRLDQENEVLDMGIKLDARVRLNDHLDLLSGYQFYEVGVSNLEDINNPPFYRLKKTVLRTHVVFSEASYTSPSGYTNVRAGVRGNYFSKFGEIRIEPRLSLNHKLRESLSIELLGEVKSQTTTQIIDFQNDFLGVEKRRWVMANEEDIPIITSKQLSAGLHFHKKNLLISMEGYGKWVNDIITSSQGFQNQFQYVRSTGSYTSLGIDFLINKRFSKINTWVSYSLAKNTYTFDELIPPSFYSNLDIRHRATVGVSYQSNHFDFSAGVNWHTGRPYTEPVSPNSVVDSEINYEDPNTSRLANYWRIDFSANYRFQFNKHIRAITGFSVWNLLNHENVIDAYYQLDNDDQLIYSQRNALGFTPNVMFRVEF